VILPEREASWGGVPEGITRPGIISNRITIMSFKFFITCAINKIRINENVAGTISGNSGGK
jgi:hypothetical protein